ncbi:MAG: hypothetical protein K0S65_4938 [Labilithrix sp.]|nr:hypothetical protein [Labilithrix sp.]
MPNTDQEADRWFEVYDAIRRSISGSGQVVSAEGPPCPSCSARDVHVLWVGDPSKRIGFAQVWCEACLRGRRFSRVAIPSAAPMLRFDEPEKAPAILDQITWVE